jgi:beta-N-acetylhexosaminidase
MTPGSTDAVLGRLMLAFDGHELPDAMAERLAARPAAGITLFRGPNVGTAAQLRTLTDAIQSLAPPAEPFLIAIDHEGGQLLGLGADATPFPGNMALGAAADPLLAERVGAAMGAELRAAGINVDYAPVADLATRPDNAALGVRSFGDDPARVAPLVAGLVRGLHSSGVATTLKHFPGMGEAAADPHHELAEIDAAADRLRSVELAPFRAAIDAGADIVMSGHVVVRALADGADGAAVPATLSRRVMRDLLRDELGFRGVTISDAFDMGAISPGPAEVVEALAALAAGVDLLLLTARNDPDRTLEDALCLAAERGLVDGTETAAALGRIAGLRRRLADGERPPFEVIGSAAHRRLAGEVAARALTLVRDEADLLPLRPDAFATAAVIAPRPATLTPADTSDLAGFALADALRRRGLDVVECLTSHQPTDSEIGAARALAAGRQLAIVGATAATLEPTQATLVEAVASTGVSVVAVALRMPWDAALLPAVPTVACTYSALEPSMEALVDALFGGIDFLGRLPVDLGGAST